jgi:hypothetical protein
MEACESPKAIPSNIDSNILKLQLSVFSRGAVVSRNAVVLACAALRAWPFAETGSTLFRTFRSATFVGLIGMEFLLALLSLATVVFVLIRRFEQRLRTQRGPWIAESER